MKKQIPKTDRYQATKQLWDESFQEQIMAGAYNTSPVESLVRCASYYLRARYTKEQQAKLHFLELGCGAGPNLIWLAQKGIRASGVDISSQALGLCRQNFKKAGLEEKIGQLIEASVDDVPFPGGSFDGIFESCVFQHLDKETRIRAFREVGRLLRPGGLFVGNMLADDHTVFIEKKKQQLKDDTGTLFLEDGKTKFYLTNIGLSHFFHREEFEELLKGFSVIDPCLTSFELPKEEAQKRGYQRYLQSMWNVYAVK